jgi:hypothetical protein
MFNVYLVPAILCPPISVFSTFTLSLPYLGMPINPMTKSYLQRMAPDLQRKVDAMRASRVARENATKTQVKAQVSALFASTA